MLARSGFSLLLCGCLLCAPILAQTAPSPPLLPTQPSSTRSAADALVDQLVENAAVLHATLPSMTAHERVESHASRGILWQNSTGDGTVRVLRASSGGGLQETHQMTVFNGKPLAPDQQKSPLQLSDGFVGSQDMFFNRRDRSCFNFTLAPQAAKDGLLELRIAMSPDYASLPNCRSGLEGLTGIARVDPATHQLTHLERTIPTQVGRRAPFASADYAPARVGDRMFWLPTTTAASSVFNKTKIHSVVHYSDYHQYTASVTIVPAGSEVEVPGMPAQ